MSAHAYTEDQLVRGGHGFTSVPGFQLGFEFGEQPDGGLLDQLVFGVGVRAHAS